MKRSSKTEYEQLQQQKIREQAVVESMQQSNENGTPYEYTEEQMLDAQKQPAKAAINNLYNNKIFPVNNGILYLFYYIFSLIIVPLLYFNEDAYKTIVGVGAWLLLVIILLVINFTEKYFQKNMSKQHKCIEYINNFANDTSVCCYLLTSLGYFSSFLNLSAFGLIYGAMLFIFLIALYYKILKPLWHDFRKQKFS